MTRRDHVTAPNGGTPGQTQQNGLIVDLNVPWVTIGDNDWAGKDATLYNANTPTSVRFEYLPNLGCTELQPEGRPHTTDGVWLNISRTAIEATS